MRALAHALGSALLFVSSAAPLIYIGALLDAVRTAMA
jgi:hypothetical protein